MRDRESKQARGREREGDTESEAGSRLRAVSTGSITGLELTDREITTWAEVGRLTDSATQVPRLFVMDSQIAVCGSLTVWNYSYFDLLQSKLDNLKC